MRFRAFAIPLILLLTLGLVTAGMAAASSTSAGLASLTNDEAREYIFPLEEAAIAAAGDPGVKSGPAPMRAVGSHEADIEEPPPGSSWSRHESWATARSPIQPALPLAGPDVAVWMWNTSGGARPGGVYVYGIEYRNDGDEPAENVTIVDTLPTSVEYEGDTSGLEHTLVGGTLTWSIASLDPGERGVFMLTVGIPEDAEVGPGEIESNNIQIATTSPDANPGNDTATANPVDVWLDEVEIGVDQWPEPSDPTPGQEFTYSLNWCNNRGSAAGPVRITDTLPANTSLVSWQPRQPWQQFWTEDSREDGRLVLDAPGLPGNMCSRLVVRLLLDEDATPGGLLVNEVVIATPGDVNPDNNHRINGDAAAGPRRADLKLDKWFNNGVLAPGGRIGFGINASNMGNIQVQGRITDTLPAGTSYQANSSRDMNGQPFDPVIVAAGYVVWDLGPLPVSTDFGFNFTIDLDEDITTGAIENCATAGSNAPESAPADNSACAGETINASGPNLRIQKWNAWNGDSQIGYQVQFQNIGDHPLDNVWISDTLPAFTTWDGWWDMGFDWSSLVSDPSSSGALRWQLSTLYPGDSGWLYYNANLDDPMERPRTYTNTVEIDSPAGEVTPLDNTAQSVLVKGEVDRVEMRVRSDGNSNLWGNAEPGTDVVVTTPYAQVTAWAEPGCGGCWNIDNAGPLHPGDLIVVEAGDGDLPVGISVPDPLYAEIDSQADTVTGAIGGWEGRRVEITGYWPGGYQEVTAGLYGIFSAHYSDIPRGADGEIRFETEIDHAQVVFHREMTNLDPILRANYGHDWVEGSYEAGHTFWITATNGAGVIKATSRGVTGILPWWNGESGFSTNESGWQPGQPDLAPGDQIFMKMDNGRTTEARIGTISGEVDGDLDKISGAVTAGWFSEELTLRCQVWADNGPPEITLQAAPNGGTYTCDFSTVGWDLLPGQNVAVIYDEPDGDQVMNVFQGPAPNLEINKRADGAPGEGGNFVFRIHYENHGDAPAENTVITDTMTGGLGTSPTR